MLLELYKCDIRDSCSKLASWISTLPHLFTPWSFRSVKMSSCSSGCRFAGSGTPQSHRKSVTVVQGQVQRTKLQHNAQMCTWPSMPEVPAGLCWSIGSLDDITIHSSSVEIRGGWSSSASHSCDCVLHSTSTCLSLLLLPFGLSPPATYS